MAPTLPGAGEFRYAAPVHEFSVIDVAERRIRQGANHVASRV
jgi:hypothetical protein